MTLSLSLSPCPFSFPFFPLVFRPHTLSAFLFLSASSFPTSDLRGRSSCSASACWRSPTWPTTGPEPPRRRVRAGRRGWFFSGLTGGHRGGLAFRNGVGTTWPGLQFWTESGRRLGHRYAGSGDDPDHYFASAGLVLTLPPVCEYWSL